MMANSQTIQTLPPLFCKYSDTGEVTPLEMCEAVAHVVGSAKVEGVQRIQNLWRIYVSDRKARADLYIKKKLIIKGKHADLYDQNPYETYQQNGQNKKDKLTIKHVPLSVRNEEITLMLTENKVVLSSPLRYSCLRNANGNLTKYLSGDRYVYVEQFDPPISRNQTVGKFPCVVIHHGKELPCKACGVNGHRIGDDNCPAKPSQEVYAFKGYSHPLSNDYAFTLNVYGSTFKSLQHAYLFRMALDCNLPDLAEDIKNAVHAGAAKRISRDIADDEGRLQWEQSNLEVMAFLLHEKANQCIEFQNCLYECSGMLIAEATNNKLWGTGLSPYITTNSTPDYWPGQNLLGAMLVELANDLSLANGQNVENNPTNTIIAQQDSIDKEGNSNISDSNDEPDKNSESNTTNSAHDNGADSGTQQSQKTSNKSGKESSKECNIVGDQDSSTNSYKDNSKDNSKANSKYNSKDNSKDRSKVSTKDNSENSSKEKRFGQEQDTERVSRSMNPTSPENRKRQGKSKKPAARKPFTDKTGSTSLPNTPVMSIKEAFERVKKRKDPDSSPSEDVSQLHKRQSEGKDVDGHT
jgi:ribA/ribD-fused uncharacterized protein